MSVVSILAAAWLATAAADQPPTAAPPAQAAFDPDATSDEPTIAPDTATPPIGALAVYQQGAIQAAYRAAEAMQGPLDGLWRLQDAAGRTLFIFALSDAGGPPAPLAARPNNPGVEGAWRDPNRAGAADASGFVDEVRDDGGRQSLRIQQGPDQRTETVSLSAGRDGQWTGELRDDGQRRVVVMSRF